MLARKWVVRLFDPEYMGIVYFNTREEGRRFLRTFYGSSITGYVTRTGL